MVRSPRKILKQLNRKLRVLQEQDGVVPIPMFMEIKFYIKHRRLVNHVIVESSTQPSTLQIEPPSEISRFVYSQLEDQKIADRSRLPVQISAVLQFIAETLSKKPAKAYPTLFVYHSRDRHRTYHLFGYLDCYMETRTYSVAELLQLRKSPPYEATKKIKANMELADIIKGKDAIMPPARNGRAKKANGDISSSTESDEVIFQGKKPTRVTNGAVQWQYRGRTGSEVASNEPLSAPAGLAAQKSEGFQRFFKAVVSPTHVRVTAGGRIVPNTRGSASPTAKWDKERPAVSGQELIDAAKDGKPEVGNAVNTQASHPIVSPQFPGYPYIQHMGLPMPLYPIQNGFQLVYGMAPQLGHPNGKQLVQAQGQQNSEEAAKAVKTQDGAGDKKRRPAPIKISPPDTFDQTRPFYYNGNVIYPAPYGPGHGGQIAMMVPSPTFSPGMARNPAYSPAAFPSSQPGGQPSARVSPQQPQPSSAPQSGVAPPITSIRPSEITRRQLDTLRTSLRYYEGQLQYNRHQIDERWTIEQVNCLRQNVQQFEHNYKAQVNFETSCYPKIGSGPTSPALQMPSSIGARRRDNNPHNGFISANDRGQSLSRFQSSSRSGPKPGRPRNKAAVGINSSKGACSPFSVDPVLEAVIKDKLNRGLGTPDSSKSTGLNPEHAAEQYNSSDSLGMAGELHSTAQAGHLIEYDPSQWGVLPFEQPGDWNGVYQANDAMAASSGLSPADFAGISYNSQPYLIGRLPPGVNSYGARMPNYVYSRELTREEKLARENYWGRLPNLGLSLPKFDGKDFYPPSPVKGMQPSESYPQSNLQHRAAGHAGSDCNLPVRSAENDPFRPGRNARVVGSQENGQKLSKAIPIVAPSDASRGAESKVAISSPSVPQVDDGSSGVNMMRKDSKISSPALSNEGPVCDKKQNAQGRRVLERSSNKSSHDLWQTMLKKGSASGSVLPSAVTSTTATGYLPPYFGNAAASLGPAISNTSNSPSRASPAVGSKAIEHDSPQPAAEKLGENCPPDEARSADYDPSKDIQERMLRDAKRRGVIGSDWQ
ncbi:hypothetical protein AAE478_005455 [Parahypoxylon ruwenzoriense]